MQITTPLTDDIIQTLKAGDRLEINGTIYTARDAAHMKLVELIRLKKPLPFDPVGAVIYYVGPTPPPPGKVIGSAGPTTSYRMDPFTPDMLKTGVRGLIGKGQRSEAVRASLRQYKAVYFAAIGGAGALISKCIKKSEVIAFPELGTEAVRRLEVRHFPVIVAHDAFGGNAYHLD